MRKIDILEKDRYDIIILGGGASGMMAAIASGSFFARKKLPAKIAIVERHCKLGRKLLATGNGHCNLSNSNIDKAHINEHYYSESPLLYESVLARFLPDQTIELFESIGILCHSKEDGKIYPFCEQAYSIVEAMEQELNYLGVKIFLNTEAKKSTKSGLYFKLELINHPDNIYSLYADKVIVAAGGKASPVLSSDGLGYDLLKQFSHTCTDLFPAIVQLKTEMDFIAPLAGIRWEAGIKLVRIDYDRNHNEKREVLRQETGEVLFTRYGISGPPVLQLARHIRGEADLSSSFSIDSSYFAVIDFAEEFSTQQLIGILTCRIEEFKDRPIRRLLLGILPYKIAVALVEKNFQSRENQFISSISPEDLAVLVSQIKNFPLKITGTTGWNEAQITAGGINCSEINENTLESRLCDGLYIAGEILDVDGDCGGYNLQFAWASGKLAGESAAKTIYEKRESGPDYENGFSGSHSEGKTK